MNLTADQLESLTGDVSDLEPSLGFVPNQNGIAHLKARHNTDFVDLPVAAGTVYPVDVKEFHGSASSPSTLGLVLLRKLGDA